MLCRAFLPKYRYCTVRLDAGFCDYHMKRVIPKIDRESSLKNGVLLVRFLLSVAASILLLTGIIKLVSVFGSAGILKVQDPVFGVRFIVLMPLVGTLEIVIGVAVLLSRSSTVAAALILWLGSEFIAYRYFSAKLSPGTYCPCLGSLGEYLGLSQASATHLTLVICVTLIVLGLLAITSSVYVDRVNSAKR